MAAHLIPELFPDEEIRQGGERFNEIGFKPILNILQDNLGHHDPVVRSISVIVITDIVTTWMPAFGASWLAELMFAINRQAKLETDERTEQVFSQSIERFMEAAVEYGLACRDDE